MCGIFGVVRRPGGRRVPGSVPVEAMEAVRHRGSGLGGGFACATAAPGDAPWSVRAVIDGPRRGDEVRRGLEAAGFVFDRPGTVERAGGGAMPFWTGQAVGAPDDAARAVDAFNARHLDLEAGRLDARVVGCSRRVDVWKDVAHPLTVATAHGLAKRRGDAWLGHTREPTNSPGRCPVWSHPFAVGDVAVVHNGDISSFGANLRLLRRLGYQSFTGTDSEAIAFLLHHLLEERGLSPEAAAKVLVDPSRGDGDPELAGAALDGPYAVAATWATAEETFLLVLVDRQKLRPLVLGEDDGAFYCASEEMQIRRVSPDARVWTPEPMSWFLASSQQGLLSAGRRHRRPGPSSSPVSPVSQDAAELAVSAQGRRFLANGYHRGQAAVLEGPVGNCLADGLDGGVVVVHGNVGDAAADAMLSGRLVVHGDARDVLGQAMQGGVVLVRGSAGNRVALQMREYEDRESPYRITGRTRPAGLTPNSPALVVGGGVDDHLGEYMAGGVAMVLNLVEGVDGLTTQGAPERPVGDRVGTGMVGGRIYVRGDVPGDAIGAAVPAEDVRHALDTLVAEGLLDEAVRDRAVTERDPDRLRALLPPEAVWVTRFLESKYYGHPAVRRGGLTPRDLALVGRALDSFFEAFLVPQATREEVLRSAWTVIDGRGAQARGGRGGKEDREGKEGAGDRGG